VIGTLGAFTFKADAIARGFGKLLGSKPGRDHGAIASDGPWSVPHRSEFCALNIEAGHARAAE